MEKYGNKIGKNLTKIEYSKLRLIKPDGKELKERMKIF